MNTLTDWNEDFHFTTSIYSAHRPEFISDIKPIFDEYVNVLKKDKDVNDVYPGIMTHLMNDDTRVEMLSRYVADVAWDILDNQGYNVDNFYTYIQSMWGQYHPRTSNMEQHSHGESSQLVGFYFIDVPNDSSQAYFYDPRAVKTHAGLPIKNADKLMTSHDSVYYVPKAGDIIITNSWLAHSFTRNKNIMPFNFLHFNIGVVAADMIEEADRPIIV